MKTPNDLARELYETTGMTETQLARLANCSQPTFNRLRRGVLKDCMASVYASLIELHQALVQTSLD
jgi:predicted transcriptional regulator